MNNNIEQDNLISPSKKRLCIFCGSSSGNDPKYKKLGIEMGKLLTSHQTDLVYGGASIGLMGIIADSVMHEKGNVFGVIPKFMTEIELAHPHISELIIVNSMHDRKFKMYQLSQAFLAIPGGMGTLDELCEILTWAQLGHHQKPCAILNFEGYFDHLLKQLDIMAIEGFLKSEDRARLLELRNLQELEVFLSKIPSVE